MEEKHIYRLTQWECGDGCCSGTNHDYHGPVTPEFLETATKATGEVLETYEEYYGNFNAGWVLGVGDSKGIYGFIIKDTVYEERY